MESPDKDRPAQRTPLSAVLSAFLHARAIQRTFRSGNVIVQEGTPGSSAYLLETGEVAAVLHAGTIRAGTLGVLTPGAWFGEIAALDGGLRTATVVAITDVVVWEIEQPALRELMEDNGALALSLAGDAVRRLRGQARRDAKFAVVETAAAFEVTLREMLDRDAALGLATGVALVDVDRFKLCNDTYGHHVGDEVLAVIANRLRASVRPADGVARWGGEEFAVAVSGVAQQADLQIVAARLHASVGAAPLATSAGALALTVSVGMIGIAHDARSPRAQTRALVEAADRLLYAAKEGGRDCVRCAWLGGS
jgi:diguanylate cyclase (GGDEF)-like protein